MCCKDVLHHGPQQGAPEPAHPGVCLCLPNHTPLPHHPRVHTSASPGDVQHRKDLLSRLVVSHANAGAPSSFLNSFVTSQMTRLTHTNYCNITACSVWRQHVFRCRQTPPWRTTRFALRAASTTTVRAASFSTRLTSCSRLDMFQSLSRPTSTSIPADNGVRHW